MGKWVETSDVERPAAELAAEILEARMQPVMRRLPLAAHEYQSDIEHVHQLRVGCRRAGAATQAFRPFFKGKAKRLKKWLRKIRRAAGPARDADVLLERLLSEDSTRSCHAYLLTRLERQRAQVQPPLTDIATDAKLDKLAKSTARAVAALRKASSQKRNVRFDAFAHDALRLASHDMFQLAGVEQPTVSQLHQLRIAGKRLRYSIELFHAAFPPALREEVYPQVEKIQERLGKLNDHATAQSLFQHWLADMPPNDRAAALARRIVEEHEATQEIRDNFLNWWTPRRVVVLESDLSALIHSDS